MVWGKSVDGWAVSPITRLPGFQPPDASIRPDSGLNLEGGEDERHSGIAKS